jgi:hypothetical protein
MEATSVFLDRRQPFLPSILVRIANTCEGKQLLVLIECPPNDPSPDTSHGSMTERSGPNGGA